MMSSSLYGLKPILVYTGIASVLDRKVAILTPFNRKFFYRFGADGRRFLPALAGRHAPGRP
jgi:hypothetical protein